MKYEFCDGVQRGILYLLKNDESFYSELIHLIKEEYFEFPVHGKIFGLIKEFKEKFGHTPNDEIILEEAKAFKKEGMILEDFEDELHLIGTLNTESIQNREYILSKVEEFAKQAAIKRALADSIILLKDGKIGDIENKIRSAITVSRNIDLGHKYFEEVEGRLDNLVNGISRDNRFKPMFTSFTKSLNDEGWGAKELIMAVAPFGVGKSIWLANQGAFYLAHNYKVLYVTLEMSEDRVSQRFDSIMTYVPQDDIKEKHTLVKERIRMFQSECPEGNLVIKEFPTKRANANTIRAYLDQLRTYENFEPDVIIVDYLELLSPTNDIQQEYLAQQRIAEELRGIAIEYNKLVITATQSNRDGKKVKIITDLELGDSYGKMRPADFGFSLNQTGEEFEKGVMRVHIIKNRNGVSKITFPIRVDYKTLQMKEPRDDQYELNEISG